MNYSKYFCNLDQVYLMITNTSSIRTVGIMNLLGNTVYRVPPRDELRFTLDVPSNIMEVDIDTYVKKRHYFNIDAVVRGDHIGPFFSRVRESVDRETLIITRSVYL